MLEEFNHFGWVDVAKEPEKNGWYQIRYAGDLPDMQPFMYSKSYWDGHNWRVLDWETGGPGEKAVFGNHRRIGSEEYWRTMK